MKKKYPESSGNSEGVQDVERSLLSFLKGKVDDLKGKAFLSSTEKVLCDAEKDIQRIFARIYSQEAVPVEGQPELAFRSPSQMISAPSSETLSNGTPPLSAGPDSPQEQIVLQNFSYESSEETIPIVFVFDKDRNFCYEKTVERLRNGCKLTGDGIFVQQGTSMQKICSFAQMCDAIGYLPEKRYLLVKDMLGGDRPSEKFIEDLKDHVGDPDFQKSLRDLIVKEDLFKTELVRDLLKTYSGDDLLETFDIFDIATLSPDVDLQKEIEKIRCCGRRRKSPLVDQYAIQKIRREAQFIGVTEVSYKRYLCLKNPSLANSQDTLGKEPLSTPPPTYDGQKDDLPWEIETIAEGTWQKQIENEEEIQKILNTSWDGGKILIDELAALVQKHPPLSSPTLLAQLVYVSICFPDNKDIKDAINKASYGASSRHLDSLFSEAFTLLHKKRPEISLEKFKEIIFSNCGASSLVFSEEEQKKQLIDAIQHDLDIKDNAAFLAAVKSRFSSKRDSRFCNFLGFGLSSSEDLIKKARVDLTTTLEELKKWRGPLPFFYHATTDNHWEEIAQSSVYVSSRTSSNTHYIGAYVSSVPEPSYGGIVFAFSEKMVSHAQVTRTDIFGTGGWYGFNRAVPVHPKAHAYKQQCISLLCQRLQFPDSYSKFQKKACAMAARLFLENWTEASFDGNSFVFKFLSDSDLSYAHVISKFLDRLKQFFPEVAITTQDPLKTVLLDDKKQFSSLCAVFCGKKVKFRSFSDTEIPIEKVKHKLLEFGYPETLPVLPYTVGLYLAFYNFCIHPRRPSRIRTPIHALRTMHERVGFF